LTACHRCKCPRIFLFKCICKFSNYHLIFVYILCNDGLSVLDL